MVDAKDLKSFGVIRAGSSPALGTTSSIGNQLRVLPIDRFRGFLFCCVCVSYYFVYLLFMAVC